MKLLTFSTLTKTENQIIHFVPSIQNRTVSSRSMLFRPAIKFFVRIPLSDSHYEFQKKKKNHDMHARTHAHAHNYSLLLRRHFDYVILSCVSPHLTFACYYHVTTFPAYFLFFFFFHNILMKYFNANSFWMPLSTSFQLFDFYFYNLNNFLKVFLFFYLFFLFNIFFS